MLFLGVLRFLDYAGPGGHSRSDADTRLAFPLTRRGRHPDPAFFRSSIARPTDTPVYASRDTSRCPPQDSGPRWIRFLLSCRTLSFLTTCRFIPALLVKGYVHEVVICCGSEVIAHHRRSYAREGIVFDALHYLALPEQKTNALDQAAPLVGWELPPEFGPLQRLLEARLGKRGKREYVQVLRLLETFRLEQLQGAVREALRLGAISIRCGQAPTAVPGRATTAAARSAELSAPSRGRGCDHGSGGI